MHIINNDMAIRRKSVEQVILKAFRKLNTSYESPKEKQLASIIGILEYKNDFVCLPTCMIWEKIHHCCFAVFAICF